MKHVYDYECLSRAPLAMVRVFLRRQDVACPGLPVSVRYNEYVEETRAICVHDGPVTTRLFAERLVAGKERPDKFWKEFFRKRIFFEVCTAPVNS